MFSESHVSVKRSAGGGWFALAMGSLAWSLGCGSDSAPPAVWREPAERHRELKESALAQEAQVAPHRVGQTRLGSAHRQFAIVEKTPEGLRRRCVTGDKKLVQLRDGVP
ncbi:MAG: hypothetical protein RJA70_3484 [Pseudomonadota bacterium]|jgi:hypothetical protein